MRIYLSGDENAARWHLPVAQAKVEAFARETEKSGLKQNRFTFLFKETGAIVHAQYVFGQVSMQIHAPAIPMVEEEVEEAEDTAVGPKTFWVNTTQGYFWVEVRYDDAGTASVIMTAFEAKDGDEWVYPGFALTAPGMISGTLEDSPESRYVLSQNGGVMAGVDAEKGTVKSTAIIDNSSRITVVENSVDAHDFVLMQNAGGQFAEIRRVGISYSEGEFVIGREYASIDMALEGETNLYVTNLLPNPAWVHRKCSGSYFSPNKTIGYHVDIGTDDGFLGNLQSVAGADLLDNTGGFEEAMFNHAPDLYRLAGLLCFPVSISGEEVTVLLVAPTMGFADDPASSKKCWGGYGLTQDWAGCVDYMQDFSSWLLAPRFVLCTVNLSSGDKSFVDPSMGGNSSTSFDIRSWDDKFGGSFVYETEYSCDTDFYSVMETAKAGDQCSWIESCGCSCDTGDPGAVGECARGWTPYSHWEYFSRENLRNSRRAYFLFGPDQPEPNNVANMKGFFLLFDGLWHLDMGVLWTTSDTVGNSCCLCSLPYGSQSPGNNVIFAVPSGDRDWILAHGHEYVTNMEIVTPLGWISWPLGGTVLGFVAKVPEEYAAPHEPVLMTGGIEYTSQTVEGGVVRCERALMSTPCTCAGNVLSFDGDSVFELDSSHVITVENGCAPFEWSAANAVFNGGSYALTDQRTFTVVVDDECSASISIKDACGTVVSMSDTDAITGVVAGPESLAPGDSGYYSHNLGADAVYTGSLQVVSDGGTSAILSMPEGTAPGSSLAASWAGKCGSSASMSVTALPSCAVAFDVWCNFGVWQGGSPPSQGQRIRVVDLPYNGGDGVFTMGSFRDDYRIIGGSYSVGSWKVFFAEYIGTLVDICVGYWPGTTDPMFYSYFMTNETRC